MELFILEMVQWELQMNIVILNSKLENDIPDFLKPIKSKIVHISGYSNNLVKVLKIKNIILDHTLVFHAVNPDGKTMDNSWTVIELNTN